MMNIRQNYTLMNIKLILLILLVQNIYAITKPKISPSESPCASDTEINNYSSTVNKIIDYLTKGPGKGQAYDRLAQLVDKFGPRMVGSKALDQSIDFIVRQMKQEQFDNVHKERVANLPLWVRGDENAVLISPVYRHIKILGLGGTIPTPKKGLCASVVVVDTFAQLSSLGSDGVNGKIVVYNQKWQGYGKTVTYRSNGANEASKMGAVAALIRSVTPKSVYSPHTGAQNMDPSIKQIPAASITVEDAMMLKRMQERDDDIQICLNITSTPKGTVDSYNTVAEIRGTSLPNEIVMISGHLDSWDVGTGAMDDAGGVVICWQALATIKALGLRPKRTIRAVFWTAEEEGYLGNTYYHKKHTNWANETFRFVYESDEGAFKPDGLSFHGSISSTCTMQKIMNLLAPINATKLYEAHFAGDVDPWRQDGVPAAILQTPASNEYYFQFHHSQGDRVTVFNRADLDLSAVLTAVIAFTTANLENPL